MSVDDHGLEVLRKSGVQLVLGDKAEYYIRVKDQELIDVIDASQNNTKTQSKITNFLITNNNTEYSHTFQDNLKSFIIRTREAFNLQLSFVETESSSNFITLKKNAVYEETNLNITGLTAYFQSDMDNVNLEIIEWS